MCFCNVSLVFPHRFNLPLPYQFYGWQVISQQNNFSVTFPFQQKQDAIYLFICCQLGCCGLDSSQIFCHGAKNLEAQILATKFKASCIRWGDREDARVPWAPSQDLAMLGQKIVWCGLPRRQTDSLFEKSQIENALKFSFGGKYKDKNN